MKAYFHKSFVLERDNISKVLAVISESPAASLQQIAEETGIGIGRNVSDGKVRPTIQYAIYCGLLKPESIESRNHIEFSELGRVVFEHDPRLKLSVSQWVMHYSLCQTENEALVWSFFVHDFLPKFSEFDPSTLKRELELHFPDLSEDNIKDYRRILISCYVDGNGLPKLRLIESWEKDKYLRGSVNYPNAYLAAYLLADIWEAKHPDRSMVQPSVLLERGHLTSTLNLTRDDLQTSLNEMSAIGAITQMREAPPFQVVRKWTNKFDLLRHAYEEN